MPTGRAEARSTFGDHGGAGTSRVEPLLDSAGQPALRHPLWDVQDGPELGAGGCDPMVYVEPDGGCGGPLGVSLPEHSSLHLVGSGGSLAPRAGNCAGMGCTGVRDVLGCGCEYGSRPEARQTSPQRWGGSRTLSVEGQGWSMGHPHGWYICLLREGHGNLRTLRDGAPSWLRTVRSDGD